MQNVETFISMIKQLLYILDKKQKRLFFCLISSSFFVALLETLGVSAIIPFILVMLSPEEFMQKQFVIMAMNFLGIYEYMQILLVVALLVVFVYIIKTITVLLVNYFQARFRNGLERDLSNAMLEAYLHQEYLFHINTNSSEVVRGVHSDVSGVASVVENFSNLISEGLTSVLIGCFLIYVNPLMAIIVLLLSGVTSLGVVLIFKKRTNLSGERCRDAFQRKIQYIQQSENGIKDIIVRQRHEYFLEQFKKYSEQACRYNTMYLCISKVPNRVVEVVFITGLLISSIFCIGRGGDASLYVTQLGAFAVAAVRILPSISSIAVYLNSLIYFRPALEATYFNLAEGIAQNSNNKGMKSFQYGDIIGETVHFQNNIHVRNVSWKYDECLDFVLKDISFDIHKGEAVAIIGASGSGKTTLVDVMLGLLSPQKGCILVDGINISDNPAMWSRMVEYVPQSIFLLDDTVKKNIAFGVSEEKIDEERIQQVLEEAQLKEMVDNLPNGIDTFLGEQGIKLSGGQRQRIAIARSLYFDPDILILDEATSALDTETEISVMDAIETLHGRKTLIIVAHRLSTIRKCDRIFEVIDGQIVLKDRNEVLCE